MEVSEIRTNDKAIQFWHFREAPEMYRKLSTNGGDEDYLAFVPNTTDAPYWMQDSGYGVFGTFCVDEYQVEGGTVYIGSHS